MELIFKEPGPEKKNQKYLENFKKSLGKDECMCQCTHVQNHVYVNKSRCMYVRNICQLLNPDWSLHSCHSSSLVLHICSLKFSKQKLSYFEPFQSY